jgi:hypothetical protein
VSNERILNRLRSIIGSARLRWRLIQIAPTVRPAPMTTMGTVLTPFWAISVKPKMTARTAAIDMTALSGSSRPASGSLYSGSTRGPRRRSAAITGSARRNTEPHQKNSRRIPPRTGPTALPAENAPIQTPMAIERCRGSWNMVKIRDRVAGASVAPAMPRAARLKMSISGLTERAARIDSAPKAAAPPSRSLRRPIRSPSAPIVMREPATKKP